MTDFEKRSYLYKQELFNCKSDLSNLEVFISNLLQSSNIDKEIGIKLLNKVNMIIEAINISIPKIHRD
jgi:hypothetical protein